MGYLRRRRAFRSSTMEGNSWRPAQGESFAAALAARDWRSQLQHDARQRIVNKIIGTLKRHLPILVSEDLDELQKIAVRFEKKIYRTANSMPDYLRKIALKMLSLETKTQHTPPINPSLPSTIIMNQNAAKPGSVHPKNDREGA
ncbi:mediator of RNA polymerase II transcription subunit 15a-like [Elaeis guineensis]|uniref:mediator of RNA polymerase II transcription subunit 15a-like n=1 Tax=Elaeis guineensis var. tenera TaxID=51953 RepID=UPI003C6D648F